MGLFAIVMYSGDSLNFRDATTLDSFLHCRLDLRRVLAEEHTDVDLAAALERAYPFDDSLEGRRIWLDALLRNAVASARTIH